jgi:glycerophosphoryl diester phosphodiesterase
VGDTRLFVEIKHPRGTRYEGIEERLVKVLRDHHRVGKDVVISFDRTSLIRLHELEPGLPTAFLTGKYVEPAQVKVELGAAYYSPHYSKVDTVLLEQVRAAGLKLSVWTVNDPEAMRAMVKAGCHAITTDDPEALLESMR